jgi:hypothetical protein
MGTGISGGRFPERWNISGNAQSVLMITSIRSMRIYQSARFAGATIKDPNQNKKNLEEVD